MRLEKVILDYGRTKKDKMAIYCDGIGYTYAELCGKIYRAASYMQRIGVEKDKIVILQAIAGCDFVAIYLAVHLMGAICAPIERMMSVEAINELKEKIGAYVVIVSGKLMGGMEDVISMHEVTDETRYSKYEESIICENERYDVLYTTGTTGKAKGVVTSTWSVQAAISNEINGSGLREDDILLIPLPLNHSFALGKLRAALFLGATVLFQNGIKFVSELKVNLEKYSCTAMIATPSNLRVIWKQAGERIREFMGGLRFLEVGGAPFRIDLREIYLERLPSVRMLNRYGSTEAPAAVYLDMKMYPDKISSIGKAVDGVIVEIIDENGDCIHSTAECFGRMRIKGDMLMLGYYGDPAMSNTVLHDGYLYSNDLAYIDKDGFIYLMGRTDDVINCGGNKIAPSEVENMIMESGLVEECVIVGVDDKYGILGQVAVLVYVSDEMYNIEKSLIEYLKSRMEEYKIPTRFKRVREIPRNRMGKINRKVIQALFSE